jgi:hypothetical protein
MTNISTNNLSNEIKANCCIENCSRLCEKILLFIDEKLNAVLKEDEREGIIDELKEYCKMEVSKIIPKLSISNVGNSNLCNNTVNNIQNLSNIQEINEGNKSDKVSNLTSENLNSNNNNNINKLNPNEVSSKKISEIITTSPQKPTKIILKNIKEIIKNNKNSRNHKDIIHEDVHTDTDKLYDLNELIKNGNTYGSSNQDLGDNLNLYRHSNKNNKNSTEILKATDKYKIDIFSRKKLNLGGTNLTKLKKRLTAIRDESNERRKNPIVYDPNKLYKRKVKSFSPSNRRQESACNKISYGKNNEKLFKNMKFSFDLAKRNLSRDKNKSEEQRDRDLKMSSNINLITEPNNNTKQRNITLSNATYTVNNTSASKMRKSFNVQEIYHKIFNLRGGNTNTSSLLNKTRRNIKTSIDNITTMNENKKMISKLNFQEFHEKLKKSLSPNLKDKIRKGQNSIGNNNNNNQPPQTNFEKYKTFKNPKKGMDNFTNLTNLTSTHYGRNNPSDKLKNKRNPHQSIVINNYFKNPAFNQHIHTNNTFISPTQNHHITINDSNILRYNSIDKECAEINNTRSSKSKDVKNNIILSQVTQMNQDKDKDIIHQIKNSLDDNLKSLFNFSYEKFLSKDFSESNQTNSDEILITNENIEKENSKDRDYTQSHNVNKNIHFTNEISFEKQEKDINNKVFSNK